LDRQQIEGKALALFRERGYANVTVQDICDACGISKPTFYSRFRSKDDIIVDFYDGVSARLSERLGELVGTTSAWEQLRICYDTIADETESAGEELMRRMLITNLHEDHHSLDERPYLKRTMASIIARGQATGEFANASDPERLCEACDRMFTGYFCYWCISHGTLGWRDAFGSSLAAVLDVQALGEKDAG
jgi:AcrR family transcriptional regulator